MKYDLVHIAIYNFNLKIKNRIAFILIVYKRLTSFCYNKGFTFLKKSPVPSPLSTNLNSAPNLSTIVMMK